jgi:sporulation protein YlmC with PRC-barrel domain
MRIDLDARVWTRDGEEVGSVQGAVVDPRTNEVTDIIVNAGTVLGRHILIPRALVPRAELERATRHGDPLRLRLSRAALEELLDYLPANYVPPPPGWVAPAGYGFPYDAYLWPAGSDYTAGFPTEQAGKLAPVGKGAVIFDRNGDEAGVVDDVRLDAESGRLRSFVARLGGPALTLLGGGKTVEIPSELVERVGKGNVHLRVGKAELRRRGRRRAARGTDAA